MRTADTLKRIGWLRQVHRDDPGAAWPQPDAAQFKALAASMEFVRLRSHAAFWGDRAVPLFNAVAGLVTGLHTGFPEFAFALAGVPGRIECWFGTPKRTVQSGPPPLHGLLDATFRNPVHQDGVLPMLPHAHLVRITGAPSPLADDAPTTALQALCHGLFGTEFLYLVHARRRPARDTQGDAVVYAQDLTDAGLQSHLEGSKGQDRILDVYLALLEAMRSRHEQGLLGGMWDAEAWLSAPQAEVVVRGAALLAGALSGPESLPDPVRATPCARRPTLTDLPLPLTSKQLAALVCPPTHSVPGYEIVRLAEFAAQTIEPDPTASPVRMLELGPVLFNGRDSGNTLSLPLDDLTSHGIIAGVTGSGKTNTCFQILAQLRANRVPFLVIESAKSEYRELIADSRFSPPPLVFTVGNETVNPLRLNPFAFPDGILVQTHIGYLKQAFFAAFEMWHPLPYVLERGLQEIYADRGWDLTMSRNARSVDYDGKLRFPTLEDLEAKTRTLAQNLGYSQENTANIMGGLVSRLGQLRGEGGKGPMFNSRESTPDHILFETDCIIELKEVGDDDEKALLIGLLLIRLNEHHEARRKRGADLLPQGTLRHVTIIEEAHRLLKNVSTAQSGESANPRGKAVESFGNLLAEIRAFGEGVLMAEQIPVKLVPDALKNTNLKIIHRLLPEDDRTLVAATMILTPPQTEQLARLQRGQAVVYAERLMGAVLVQVPRQAAKLTARIGEDDLPARTQLDTSAVHAMITARQARDAAGYSQLWVSFVALLYALLEARPDVATIRRLYESGSGWRGAAAAFLGSDTPAEIVFLTMLDAEIEVRGRYVRPNAPFWLMHVVAEQGRAIAGWLARGGRADAVPEALQGFQGIMRRLHGMPPEMPPFEACDTCDKPCLYRPMVLDILLGQESAATAFTTQLIEATAPETFADRLLLDDTTGRVNFSGIDPAPWQRLRDQAMGLTDRTFRGGTESTRVGAAYCYMLHHLYLRAGLPSWLAPSVADWLQHGLHSDLAQS